MVWAKKNQPQAGAPWQPQLAGGGTVESQAGDDGGFDDPSHQKWRWPFPLFGDWLLVSTKMVNKIPNRPTLWSDRLQNSTSGINPLSLWFGFWDDLGVQTLPRKWVGEDLDCFDYPPGIKHGWKSSVNGGFNGKIPGGSLAHFWDLQGDQWDAVGSRGIDSGQVRVRVLTAGAQFHWWSCWSAHWSQGCRWIWGASKGLGSKGCLNIYIYIYIFTHIYIHIHIHIYIYIYIYMTCYMYSFSGNRFQVDHWFMQLFTYVNPLYQFSRLRRAEINPWVDRTASRGSCRTWKSRKARTRRCCLCKAAAFWLPQQVKSSQQDQQDPQNIQNWPDKFKKTIQNQQFLDIASQTGGLKTDKTWQTAWNSL